MDISNDANIKIAAEAAAEAAKIAEIQAEGKFSSEEIASFVTLGKRLAGKAVLSMVIDLARAHGASKQLTKRLTKAIPFDCSGFIQCSFTEIPYKLNVSLSIVDKDYRTSIDIPHADYVNDLYTKYNFLKDIAQAYWSQFAEENAGLYKELVVLCADVDFSKLHSEESNPTTMYFDASSAKRIGIFCYYVNEAGAPLRKVGKN